MTVSVAQNNHHINIYLKTTSKTNEVIIIGSINQDIFTLFHLSYILTSINITS